MAESLTEFSKYLPVEPHARDWGLYVMDCGFTEVSPGSTYPPGKHPDEYMFTWQTGRTLTEHHLVYISRGAGYFETNSSPVRGVAAGDMLVLHKGAWHRYRPAEETGWDEFWVGFGGEYADHLMAHFFDPKQPVIGANLDGEFIRIFRALADNMRFAPPGFAQIMAAYTVEILARLRAKTVSDGREGDSLHAQVQRARLSLLARFDEDIDLQVLARELGLSYSSFRRRFKAATGSSPRQYHLQIRLNRSKALLTGTNQPISLIADRVGFSSVYYFSRFFKKALHMSPGEYRRTMSGRTARAGE